MWPPEDPVNRRPRESDRIFFQIIPGVAKCPRGLVARGNCRKTWVGRFKIG